MRKIVIIILLILDCVAFAQNQNPEIKTNLPTIIPPSPTVAALMKFEEVPVSNYTGIPDISIPLFNCPTHSKDINLDISIKYHPNSVAGNEKSSDVGLGWSLFSGGTVSRTVNGLPDEVFIVGGQSSIYGSGKIGIYHEVNSTLHGNSYGYYDFLEHYNSTSHTTEETNCFNEFVFEASEKNKFDSEHDLWQFNFFGRSGRFMIKKNTNTNQLEIVPLSSFIVKIENYYTLSNDGATPKYTPTSFIIYDEKGYKYIFDQVEKTTTSTSIRSDYTGWWFPETTYAINALHFNSSFHLSQVYDNNNKLLIEYAFKDGVKESTSDKLYTRNIITDSNLENTIETLNCNNLSEVSKIRPHNSTTVNTSVVEVKKIKKINVTDQSVINFSYQIGRLDDNIINNELACVLKEISVKRVDSVLLKKIHFNHSYQTVIDKRLILDSISEERGGQFLSYDLYYYNQEIPFDHRLGLDCWGYFNVIPNCMMDESLVNESSPNYSKLGVLQKIKYPTQGSVIFDFESNDYSFEMNTPITDFSTNPNNKTYLNSNSYTFTETANSFTVATHQNKRFAKFNLTNLSGNPFFLQKKVNNNWVLASNLNCGSGIESCCFEVVLEQNMEYRINRGIMNIGNNPNDSVTIDFYQNSLEEEKKLYGAGIRIKTIGYFDKEVDQEYYQLGLNSVEPAKEKNYSYSLFEDSQKSSGALVLPKPIFEYSLSDSNINFSCGYAIDDMSYNVLYKHSNLSYLRSTQGEVGYKNVKVYESQNGYSKHTYTSPIEIPEVMNFVGEPPYFPFAQKDYLRGLELSREDFNEQGNILQGVYNNYNFDEQWNLEDEVTLLKGIRFTSNCKKTARFKTYAEYFSALDYCGDAPEMNFFNCTTPGEYNINYPPCPCQNLCGETSDFINTNFIYYSYGWIKLNSKVTKNFFYDSNNNQRVVETTETYDYNPLNKQISESTVTNSKDEIIKTKYFYHTGNSVYSKNRISEIESIETYRGNELLSTSKINYSNNWSGNVSYLPQSIHSSKGTAPLESNVIYSSYDTFSTPLELRQENDIYITYIWGYNKTQPIAKIENATNAQVQTALGMSLSNVTEANMGIINGLRGSLPNAMVTTFTYIPLVGIQTITDPKGNVITYVYDSFGRLSEVKDKDSNKLSENLYHYKTQN